MFSQSVIDAAREHASKVAPMESCGLVVDDGHGQAYIQCSNMSSERGVFIMSSDEFAAVEDCHNVIGVVHSHHATPPTPSQADLVGCESSGLPWLIVNHPVGDYHVMVPSGYVAPLRGREFHHGVFDCYSIIRDYYQQELSIELPNYHRDPDWWLNGGDLYMQYFADAGFEMVPIESLRKHDVILMKCRSSVINHGAVYIGDTKILQHLVGRLSGEDTYNGYWRKITVGVIRHKDLM